MNLSRTQLIFAGIVGLAVVFVVCALTFNFAQQLIGGGDDPADVTDNGTGTSTATTGDGDTAVNVTSDTVLVTLASSNTKRNWLDQVVADFNGAGLETDAGNPVVVEVSHVTSGGSMNAILDGESQPVAWSPGDGSWVNQANETWERANNVPIASQSCEATIYAPLGFAMWRPMAETLGWPNTPIGWDTIVELAADPDGWASYGNPEWGQFTFGHTHPAYANSGLLSMTGFVYGIAGETSNLTAADVYAPEVEAAMANLEQNTAKYGRQAPALLELMASEGASYLHAAAVPEAEVVRFNVERGSELDFPLAFIFPSGGTIWADHPYCILDNADWVDEQEAEGAQIFFDYLTAEEQQEMAIANYLRPLDDSIPLSDPMSLEFGTDPSVSPSTVPPLPSPDADISAAVIDLFQTTKRKATIMMVIDVSGSMQGERISTARTSTAEFLERLDPNDNVGVMVFSDNVTTLSPIQRAGDVRETLAPRVQGLIADGNTNLYSAVCDAVEQMTAAQEADLAAGEARLYGIVVLSDGEDTVGEISENRMFSQCLPASAEADGIKIFPIAFGDDADQAVLQRMAQVTAGRAFTADPQSISRTYLSISAEQ